MEISIETIRKAFKKYHADASGGAPCKTEAIEAEAYQHGALWMQETLQVILDGIRASVQEYRNYIARLRAENETLTKTAQDQFNMIQNLRMRTSCVPPPASIEVAGLQWELQREREMYCKFTTEKDDEIRRLSEEYNKLSIALKKRDEEIARLEQGSQALAAMVDDRGNTINSMSETLLKKGFEIAVLKEAAARKSLMGCVECQKDRQEALDKLEALKAAIAEIGV